MPTFQIYQIDAFANALFGGNQAAVVVLNDWLDHDLLQKISEENNLSETAFIVKQTNGYQIRWFTPNTEVALCGHATLAAGFVVLNLLLTGINKVNFYSPLSGDLEVEKMGELFQLNFPVDTIEPFTERLPTDLLLGIGNQPAECFTGKTDFLMRFNTQTEVENLKPDFVRLSRTPYRGIIVTAPGNDCDFVVRFFAPRVGINEDPVTGSAYTTLAKYWNQKSGKSNFDARQLSARGGHVQCTLKGQRVLISGKAKLYLKGDIFV